MSNRLAEGPVLALDTATPTMTAAVASGGGAVICERTSLAERNHSVRLLPVVDELLREAGVAARDLGAIAVGCGPGSYTGVRIAVTAAKTMAWALGLPVYAVSSLEALALGGYRAYLAAAGTAAEDEEVWIVPLLDARRGQAYTALFAAKAAGAPYGGAGAAAVGGTGAAVDGAEADAAGTESAGAGDEPAVWRRLAADAIVPFREQAEAWLGEASRPRRIVFVGDVESRAAAWMDEAFADGRGESAGAVRLPVSMQARDIAAIARRHGEAARAGDPHDLLPNYAQLAEAEVKLAEAASRGDER